MKKKYLGWILLFVFLGICIFYISSLNLNYLKKENSVVMRDFFNRNVIFTQPPSRIVCLSPSLTEIIYSLGLGGKIIGVSEVCYLPKVANLPKFNLYDKSGFKKDAIEEIANLKPDLVLLWATTNLGFFTQAIENFEEKNIKVLTFGTPKNMEEIFLQIRTLAEVFNQKKRAEQLIRKMENDINQIKNKTKELDESKKLRVYMEIQKNPIISVGGDNYLNQILELAGGKNIFEDKEGWPMVTPDEVIIKDPQVILFVRWESSRDEILHREHWQKTSAVRKGRIYEVDGYSLKQASSSIVRGLKKLARLLHPELFSN